MDNVEIRPSKSKDQFCCCDQGDNTCQKNLEAFSSNKNKCASNKLCDTYFVVTLSDYQNFEPCPTMLQSNVFTENSTSTDVNYKFQFFLGGAPSESV